MIQEMREAGRAALLLRLSGPGRELTAMPKATLLPWDIK